MTPSAIEITGTILFALAIIHTFLVKRFQHLARSFPDGSVGENLFHLLGEVEVVFGIWSAFYIIYIASYTGSHAAAVYVQSKDFTEPLFVFVIMAVCSTRPILELTNFIIQLSSRLIPGARSYAFYVTVLTLGTWLGSFITEPAAMTVSALLLYRTFYKKRISERLKYATLGLLFVNISIGGTITHFAAPPVLMVAEKWHWNFYFMLSNFGWKGILASVISTLVISLIFKKEISAVAFESDKTVRIPLWVSFAHLLFLVMIVLTAHYPAIFVGIFLFFLGLVTVTKEYQDILKLRSGMLVGFFLGGLVILGGPQRWWLQPVLEKLEIFPLYISSIALTAITDNAALTYLGSLVPGISDSSKYALVAGAVVGGGLTIIANAPNPAGYGILNPAFGEEGISPLRLLQGAMLPTIISAVIFWFL